MKLRTILIALAALAALAACDAGRGVERLSETDLVLPEAPAAAALPAPEDTGEAGGFLTRLLTRSEPEPETAVATTTDGTTADGTTADGTTADGTTADGTGPASAAAVNDPPADQAPEAAPGTAAERVVAAEEPAPRRGLLSRLVGSGSGQATGPQPSKRAEQPAVQTDALTTDPAPDPAAPEPAAPTRSAGLFGLFAGGERGREATRLASLGPAPSGGGRDAAPAPAQVLPPRTVDTADVAPGTVLPFGQIARTCDATRRDFGRRIEAAPKRGEGFALYDSDPSSTAPRTWYVTGFADGCARQFTAALAIFGAPSSYENLRYALPASAYTYGETDRSYDRIKSRLCGVSRGTPCGTRIERVERNTVFVSTYERFEGSARWADILLHDGAVMAKAIKEP